MSSKFRCNCPITSTLDILGDKWMIVIIKQILIEGKRTFKDFTESSESIATNILSAKLKILEEFDIIRKTKLPHNKKTNLYLLTDIGLGLTPIIVELAAWGDGNLRKLNPTLINNEAMELLRSDKNAFANLIESRYRETIKALNI
ncbi:DNA-binding transcriptional regulator, HxlR family [Tenacibaculum sp. MAR_2009_124]|uniref:winged helix-turn-helix transcriptional regulator n=1 Tax=Tenacibaculum sp. MAR_2009_124 TaxID=1250059 RepID=UPI0008967401|nr:helix-turn-helix domain-containing protein [Tenacibaculum sp. MAR_2009_124]SEB41350.1 DNA-binding transcriptional regulator, HxlR family [Tenacibaculum sp. MAR_2009_124]